MSAFSLVDGATGTGLQICINRKAIRWGIEIPNLELPPLELPNLKTLTIKDTVDEVEMILEGFAALRPAKVIWDCSNPYIPIAFHPLMELIESKSGLFFERPHLEYYQRQADQEWEMMGLAQLAQRVDQPVRLHGLPLPPLPPIGRPRRRARALALVQAQAGAATGPASQFADEEEKAEMDAQEMAGLDQEQVNEELDRFGNQLMGNDQNKLAGLDHGFLQRLSEDQVRGIVTTYLQKQADLLVDALLKKGSAATQTAPPHNRSTSMDLDEQAEEDPAQTSPSRRWSWNPFSRSW
jgi:hypothetical protein